MSILIYNVFVKGYYLAYFYNMLCCEDIHIFICFSPEERDIIMKSLLIFKKFKNSTTYKFYLKCYQILFLIVYLSFIGLNIAFSVQLEEDLTRSAYEQNIQNYELFQDTIKMLDRISVGIASQSELRAYHIKENIEYPYKISSRLKSMIQPYTIIHSISLIYTNSSYSDLQYLAFTDAGIQNSENIIAKYIALGVLPDNFSLTNPDDISGRFYTGSPGANEQKTTLFFSQIPSSYPVSSGIILYELDETELTRQIKAQCIQNSIYKIYDVQDNLLLQIGSETDTGKAKALVYEDPYRGNKSIYQYNAKEYYTPLYNQLLIFLLSAILLLIVLYLLSIYLARLTYKPIAHLSSFLNPNTSEEGFNELQMLERLFDNLKQENQKISTQLTNQSRMIREQVTYALIREVDSAAIVERLGEEANQYLKELYTFSVYCCVIITIDDYLETFIVGRSAQQQWLDRHTVTAFLQEQAADYGYALCMDGLNTHSMTAIFASKNAEGIQYEVNCLCEKVRDFVQFNFNFTVTLSYGWHTDKLDKISLSYQDADCLMQYRFLLGKNTVINTEKVDEILQKNSGKKQNHHAQIQKVLDTIQSGKETDIEQTVTMFFENLRSDTNPTSFRFAYMDLLTKLKNILYNSEIHSLEIYLYQLEQLYATNEYTMKEIEKRTQQLCKQLCREFYSTNADLPRSSAEDIPSPKRYQQILSYIIENLSNSNLCLNMIAEHFSMNPSYLTRLFKNSNGKTLMKYVDDLRFDNSKTLLMSTNLPIKEIVHQVGYIDENNFSRKFRSKEGMAPQKYRELYKNK